MRRLNNREEIQLVNISGTSVSVIQWAQVLGWHIPGNRGTSRVKESAQRPQRPASTRAGCWRSTSCQGGRGITSRDWRLHLYTREIRRGEHWAQGLPAASWGIRNSNQYLFNNRSNLYFTLYILVQPNTFLS